uniref:procollagen-proline 4-dioxygenase n=2 Tax=Tetraselmis sp. GSL018 TaxID=582737 RepID=A0A061R6Q9_9CHLO|mmetsp:Transcript_11515/g.27333  ORF Transcript_11515/g.27333 Transcript_11515/m.27333 type:complete len:341 (+) Transcript_11515:287-1309(+)
MEPVACLRIVFCILTVATTGTSAATLKEPSIHDDAPLSVIDGPNAGMQVLSWEHRIFYHPHFLSPEEADHIKALAEPELSRSGVVDTATGQSKVDDIRTSSGTFLKRKETDIVAAVEQRIAEWTLLPLEYGESLQVLRYENAQKYKAHWDYFFHEEGRSNGGNRICTVLMYLEDTEEGGETTFPNIPAPGGANEGFSECARDVLAVKPTKGAAVMFWSTKPTGELNRESLHEACPVIRGTKWSAVKWIHMAPFAVDGEQPVAFEEVVSHRKAPARSAGECRDEDVNCAYWARTGECDNNPAYMVGTAGSPGHCLESCGRCDVAEAELEGTEGDGNAASSR